MTDPAPVAVVVAGPAGSGKSTLGRELARVLGAALLDQDVLTQPLTALIAEMTCAGDDLDHPAMTGPVRRARYDTVLSAAVDNLRVGQAVVLVAPFTRELADPAALADLVTRLLPAPVVLVRVRVPIEVARARRSVRDLPRDRAALARTGASPPAVPPRHLADPGGSADAAGREVAGRNVAARNVAARNVAGRDVAGRNPTGGRPVLDLPADGLVDPGSEAVRILTVLRSAQRNS